MSDDMVELSRQVRNLFDKQGLSDVRIFASGGYDEYKPADRRQAVAIARSIEGAADGGFGFRPRPQRVCN
jgi:nicotinic acid phosphoribosyltransferase